MPSRLDDTEQETGHGRMTPRRRLAWLSQLTHRSNWPVIEGSLLGRLILILLLMALGFAFVGLFWYLGSTWAGLIHRAVPE